MLAMKTLSRMQAVIYMHSETKTIHLKGGSTASMMWLQYEEPNIWSSNSPVYSSACIEKEIQAAFPEISYLSAVINLAV